MTREQLRDGQRAAEKAARTIWIPTELNGLFRTHEGLPYHRDRHGVMRRGIPKVRGKAARRADKRARRAVDR